MHQNFHPIHEFPNLLSYHEIGRCNIQVNLTEIDCEDEGWMNPAQKHFLWGAIVSY
jgi:hypothetical protein